MIGLVRMMPLYRPQTERRCHIGVSAKDGAVVLTGHVSSYVERMAALSAAERIYGVRAAADETEVKLADASVSGDAEIAETISRQLQANRSATP